MKRLLLLSVLTFFLHATSWAYDFEIDSICYNIVSSEDLTCEVTYSSSNTSVNARYYADSISIPETVDYHNRTYSVARIGSSAFASCTGLKEVTIPNSVTSIGTSAFEGCTGLMSVTIPESVTSIGEYAFMGCTGLMSITIPEGVTTIDFGTFSGCSGLTEITIPNSVTKIGVYAFELCTGLTGELTIPNSVISIGHNAFIDCTGLTSLTIGESVTTIDSNAFWGCMGLTSIYSLNPEPPNCEGGAFYDLYTSACVLYVPEGSLEAYSTAYEWEYFLNIEEFDVTPVNGIITNGNAEATGYYTTDGKQVPTLQRGINIIRYSDGTARKVLVK